MAAALARFSGTLTTAMALLRYRAPARAVLFVHCVLCALVALSAPARAQDWSAPGPYAVGSATVTVTRPSGSTFSARLHYPAQSQGAGTPFEASGAPYPGVSFGHGFLQPVDSYTSTLAHLASWGHVVIATTSQGGLFPSHSAFAADLSHCLTWLELQSADPASPYFGGIDAGALGLSGHSMGGGASLLAAAADARVRAVVPLAPANTNPSSIAAAAGVTAPTRIVAGTEDTVVPTGANGAPMYTALAGPRQLVQLVGGWHCGFVDSVVLGGIGCDSGALTRAAQLALVRRECAQFFRAHLARDPAAIAAAWELPHADPLTPTERDLRFTLTPRSARAAAPAGQVALVRLEVRNDSPVPVRFRAEVASAWPVTVDPVLTAPVAPGASVTLDASVTVPVGLGEADRALVTVVRDADGVAPRRAALAFGKR